MISSSPHEQTKWDESREWRRLHNEELYSWYNSPNIAKYIRLRWADHVPRMEEGRNAFKILTGKPTGKRLLGRPRIDWRTILEWILKK